MSYEGDVLDLKRHICTFCKKFYTLNSYELDVYGEYDESNSCIS